MTVSIALLLAMAVLYACGVYLLLEQSVTRIIIGILLLGNATNLLLLSLAGPPGAPPIAGSEGESSDPLPQALILTAIVITFAVSAFLMALVYRSWRLAREDEVTPDEADIALRTGEGMEPEAASPDEESEFDRPEAAEERTVDEQRARAAEDAREGRR